jgi:2-polyprenyl-6-hydroxyphenyl methylase/3-demethylubiquinone-9 3-methyltransferase
MTGASGSPSPPATLSEHEIAHFRSLARGWWVDHKGPWQAMHALNPARLQYIHSLCTRYLPGSSPLDILDVGCGGGLLSVPLARQGHRVTGLDACTESIDTARTFSESQGLAITWCATDAATFATTCPPNHPGFDVVLLMDILEHVPSPGELVRVAAGLLRPGGLFVFSTLNRTWLSGLLAIGWAEHVVRMVPRGTHRFQAFLRPSEVLASMKGSGISPVDLTGLVYNPLSGTWVLKERRLRINYAGCGRKDPIPTDARPCVPPQHPGTH